MQRNANGKVRSSPPGKRLVVLFTLSLISIFASSQNLTLSVKSMPIDRVFELVERQSPYRFIYSSGDLQQARPVSFETRNATIETVLHLCFRAQPLTYNRDAKYIIVKADPLKPATISISNHRIKGRVINNQGEPVPGVTIMVKGTKLVVTTDANGEFQLDTKQPDATLEISGAEIQLQEVKVSNREYITIQVNAKIAELDKVVMIAYGTTTRRLSTGNITKVSAGEIERQPVSNPIAALSGRVPGLIVTQTSGVPGTAMKVEIRGRSSLDLTLSANDPLYVIDGIPFAPGSNMISQLTSAANNPRQATSGGISPLSSINPADIESIEVLKDADATAIYGSRGANGVILITTKKGVSGKTRVNASLYYGQSRVARSIPMMNTADYLQMRREAFKNDGISPTLSTAPDLVLWDTTRYTNFSRLLTGGTASALDAQVSLSGGNALTNFIFGGSYNRQTTVFPGDFSAARIGTHFAINHTTPDRKFASSFTGNYSYATSNLLRTDLSTYINLPPNMPALYDSAGNLAWTYKNTAFPASVNNPLADLLKTYKSTVQHLNLNTQLQYKVTSELLFRLNAGVNLVTNHESLIIPKQAIVPTSTTLASSQFGDMQSRSFILEPQIEYRHKIGAGLLKVLAGATVQHIENESTSVNGTNYTSDLQLFSLSGAGTITATNAFNEYRYAALFGRLNYNYRDRYIINVTGRRDGSSRFGPGKQFANFGAVGVAWVFSHEKFLEKWKWLSFGKLRASYGITGSDQIGDYKYLDSWTNTANPYQGVSALRPTRLFNPDYRWERNRKFEIAADLGWLKDRLLFFIVWFRNLSGNQLVNYQLPSQAGFLGIVMNFPALVRNSGIEMTTQAQLITKPHFKWSLGGNISFPRNKLLEFPGLLSSPYYLQYEIGQPLSLIKSYRYLGVNPETGIYEFIDADNSGTFGSADRLPNGSFQARFYGGVQQTLQWKNIVLDIFFEFRKQRGLNFLANPGSAVPGTLVNQPNYILQRWQKPGDISPIQRLTTRSGTAGYTAAINLGSSEAIYSDASFARLKNISLTWNLPASWLKKMKMDAAKLYLLGQNIATITGYRGADPENQNLYVLPPLRTIAAGIQLTL